MKKRLTSMLLVATLTLSMGTSVFATTQTGVTSDKNTVEAVEVTPAIKTANMIGVIGAMEEEVEILKSKMLIEEEVIAAGMTFYKGTLHEQPVVLVRSGVGKVNAAACAQLLITLFDVDYLINSGVAGAMHTDLNQGDIVISTDAVQHDFDVTALGDPLGEISRLGITYFEADKNLIEVSKNAAESLNLEDVRVFEGRVASGDQFIAGGEKAENIKTHFSPYATEMEGAAIAHIAYLNEVPYVIIRAISDKADGEAELSYPEFLPIAAKNASALLEEIIKLAKDELPIRVAEEVVEEEVQEK